MTLQAELQKLQQRKSQMERELTRMHDARDRLAGQLGKQTGVAVQLARPQHPDEPARRRPTAVRGLLFDCTTCLSTMSCAGKGLSLPCSAGVRLLRCCQFDLPSAVHPKQTGGLIILRSSEQGFRHQGNGMKMSKPSLRLSQSVSRMCRASERWTTRAPKLWPST